MQILRSQTCGRFLGGPLWAECRGISLNERFLHRKFLTLPEIESLRDFVQSRARTSVGAPSTLRNATVKIGMFRRFESARVSPGVPRNCVSNATLYTRLTYIASYVRWLALLSIEDCHARVPEEVRSQINAMVQLLHEMRPRIPSRSRIDAKKGLSREAFSQLISLVEFRYEETATLSSQSKRNKAVRS
jgi:hypothetical protein